MRKLISLLVVVILAAVGYSVVKTKYPDLLAKAQAAVQTSHGTSGSGGSGGGSGNGAHADGNAGKAGGTDSSCPDQGPLTSAMLPTFEPGEVNVITNPCLGFSDGYLKTAHLLAAYSGDSTKRFLDQVDKYASGAEKVNAAVECAYETDRLAIDVYQHRKWHWSVGFVAVVRGDAVDVALDNLKCQIRRAVFQPIQGIAPNPQPVPDFCFDTARHGDFTTVWIGSSDLMCSELGQQLK